MFFYSIALSHYFLGNYKKAAEYFRRVQRFQIPDNQKVLIHYGLAQSLKLSNQKPQARKEFRATVEAATEESVNYWQQQLQKIGDFQNRPSNFVKEVIQYVSSHKA